MTLTDPRVKKQAKILVNYSIKLKKKDNVIVSGDFEAKPLIYEIYRLLIKGGAGEVKLHFNSYELSEIFFKNATEAQLKNYPKISDYEIKNMDCYIRIASSSNTRGLTGVDTEKINLYSKTTRPISDYRVENTRWVVTRFPTEAQAQEADMSLSDYENFVFNAINKVDWKKKFKEQQKIKTLLDKTNNVRIKTADTDLTFNKNKRNAENAGGENNMPDGEIFTSAVEDSANGFITYSYPAIYTGREFANVRLEFKKGKVVKATASKNENDLVGILDSDKGARFIGEFGIGNNYKIKKFTKDILFDEKIGGSIHIALGRGYKKTGSKNRSSIHWDMIKDLRFGGELRFDDKLVQKNGKWLI
jgi:aminopeptidase